MASTRTWIITGTAVVLAAGLGLTADRVVAGSAAGRLADRLGCVADLGAEPQVTFGGVPFLTQLARGTFDEITVRVPEVTVKDLPVSVEVAARDVHLPDGGAMRAGSVHADVTVGYAGLARLQKDAGGTFGWDGGGRLTTELELQMGGRSRSLTVYATPAISDDRLVITPEEVELTTFGIRVPADRLGERAEPRTVDLPDLPDGLGYQSAEATADGLRLTVTGSDLEVEAGASGHECVQD